MDENKFNIVLLLTCAFLVIQIILFVIAKNVHNKYTPKQKDEKILDSHNKIRSIFINMVVATAVIFIPEYTSSTDKQNLLLFLNKDTIPNYLIWSSIIILIIFPIISYILDIKNKRVSLGKLNKIIFRELFICTLTVGSIFALLFHNTAYILSGAIALISLCGILLI